MDRYKDANLVSKFGIGANIFLFIIKIVIGLISRSQGMIADGLNSASDIVSSIMTYAGNKIAGKPKDDDHPYGHGKAEYIFSMLISLVMITVSVVIFKSSIKSIISQQQLHFSIWIVVVCIVTIVIKALLYIYSHKIGKRDDNILVIANSIDHRNDMFLTLSTLIGVISSLFGVFWVDGVVGIFISMWIFISATQIFFSAFRVLMDSDRNPILKDDITKLVNSYSDVGHIDSINLKPVGVNFLAVIKISVDGEMTVNKSHELASCIKYKLLEDRRVADVVVHINPM